MRKSALLVVLALALGLLATASPAGAQVAPVQARSGAGHVTTGYWQVESDGQVFAFGEAVNYAVQPPPALQAPVVGAARTPDGGGLWLVGADGGVFTLGRAGFFGSTGNLVLDQPVVGMAATPDGGGYWLVARRDGGVFAFGDARFFGSTGGLALSQPIVGMAATPDGGGYWLVASDGGIFAFGDARFFGSTGNLVLNQPVVGMAATPDGGGYWLVARDGGIFTFGDARFFGSTGNLRLAAPITSMAPTTSGDGYWLEGADGGIFTFGDAEFDGSGGGSGYPAPSVAVVPESPPVGQIAAGSVFEGAWYEHGAGLVIGTDGRFSLLFRTYNWCGIELPGPCDFQTANLIIDGGGLGGMITSVSGDSATTTVTYDPVGAAAGMSDVMTYDPGHDAISFDGFLLCGTAAPAGYCGA